MFEQKMAKKILNCTVHNVFIDSACVDSKRTLLLLITCPWRALKLQNASDHTMKIYVFFHMHMGPIVTWFYFLSRFSL